MIFCVVRAVTIAMQRLGKQTLNNRATVCRGVHAEELPWRPSAECLHRDPASRKKRRNGKSQIWDSEILSRVPRDSDPRKTELGRPSSIYNRQTRPLVREGAPQKQDRNCQIVIAKYLVMSPRWASTPRLTDCLTVSHNVTLTLTCEFRVAFQYNVYGVMVFTIVFSQRPSILQACLCILYSYNKYL
jgi:hypothetical protein